MGKSWVACQGVIAPVLSGVHLSSVMSGVCKGQVMAIDSIRHTNNRLNRKVLEIHFIRGLIVHVMHPAVPIWLDHCRVGVVNIGVLNPSMLAVWKINILIVVISKFIHTFENAKLQITNLTKRKRMRKIVKMCTAKILKNDGIQRDSLCIVE